MKNFLVLLIVSLLSFSMNSQSFEVTPNGLLDSDSGNNFLVVDLPNKTSKDLYKSTINYIKENYKNPSEVIKSTIENELIRFETYVPSFSYISSGGVKINLDAKYTTEIRFKDNKIRYEISNIDIRTDNTHRHTIYFQSKGITWYFYNSRTGKLKQPDLKEFTENYFNNSLNNLIKYLNEGGSNNDGW